MRNSTFANNCAELDTAGAIYLAAFAVARFEGDDNNFTSNICGMSGGVLAATSNTNVTVEGGWFLNNKAEEVNRMSSPNVPPMSRVGAGSLL